MYSHFVRVMQWTLPKKCQVPQQMFHKSQWKMEQRYYKNKPDYHSRQYLDYEQACKKTIVLGKFNGEDQNEFELYGGLKLDAPLPNNYYQFEDSIAQTRANCSDLRPKLFCQICRKSFSQSMMDHHFKKTLHHDKEEKAKSEHEKENEKIIKKIRKEQIKSFSQMLSEITMIHNYYQSQSAEAGRIRNLIKHSQSLITKVQENNQYS